VDGSLASRAGQPRGFRWSDAARPERPLCSTGRSSFRHPHHPEATFDGTVKVQARGAEAFVQGFRNLGPIIDRNEIRELIVEGGRAFVLYDLVTDTPVGPVLCGELLTVEDGLICSSTLIFDWRRWPEVLHELQGRIGAAAPLS
jgi:hypothetical protein